MSAENCLLYIYTRVWDGLELRFEVPQHSQCLPSLFIQSRERMRRLSKRILDIV